MKESGVKFLAEACGGSIIGKVANTVKAVKIDSIHLFLASPELFHQFFRLIVQDSSIRSNRMNAHISLKEKC